MSPDGHTHNNYSAANAAELLLYVWPFWDMGHERVLSWFPLKNLTMQKYEAANRKFGNIPTGNNAKT